MKLICLLFLWIISFCTKAQKVTFRLYTTDACTGMEKLDSECFLNKSPGMFFDTAYTNANGIVDLPDTGNYFVFPHGSYSNPVAVYIKYTGPFNMRYKDSLMMTSCCGIDQPPIYVSCGKAINGYKEDFYSNGKVRIRGTFFNGFVKDSLAKFFSNGQIAERETKLSKQVFVTYYDSIGNKISDWHSFKIRPGYLFDHTLVTYYPNGQIKTSESSVNHIQRSEKYYSNGTLEHKQDKWFRTEYSENGKLIIKYNWKYKRDGHSSYDLVVKKSQFDMQGNILEILTYEIWEFNGKVGFDKRMKPDWIIDHKLHQNGKLIKAEKGIDAKEYLKQHTWDTVANDS